MTDAVYVGRIFTGPTDANGLPTVYYENWQSLTNLSDAQQAWFRSQKQWLMKYTGITRWVKESAGITVNGIPVKTSNNYLGLLSGLGLRALRDKVSNPSAVYAFTIGNAVETITVDQALSLFDAVSGFIQTARSCEKALIDGINAGSITSEPQIDAALATIPTVF